MGKLTSIVPEHNESSKKLTLPHENVLSVKSHIQSAHDCFLIFK